MAATDQELQQEEELVRRIQAGDDKAFDRLVDICGPRVYAIIFRMIGNHEDALDLVQDTFLNVYQSLPRFRGQSTFRTWLYRITVNICYDELARRRNHHPTISAIESETATEADSLLDKLSTGETPDDLCLQHEREHILEQLILQLPADQRIIVLLHDIQGMCYDEIAAVINTRVGTVKSRLHRAHLLLREQIFQSRELFKLQISQS